MRRAFETVAVDRLRRIGETCPPRHLGPAGPGPAPWQGAPRPRVPAFPASMVHVTPAPTPGPANVPAGLSTRAPCPHRWAPTSCRWRHCPQAPCPEPSFPESAAPTVSDTRSAPTCRIAPPAPTPGPDPRTLDVHPSSRTPSLCSLLAPDDQARRIPCCSGSAPSRVRAAAGASWSSTWCSMTGTWRGGFGAWPRAQELGSAESRCCGSHWCTRPCRQPP